MRLDVQPHRRLVHRQPAHRRLQPHRRRVGRDPARPVLPRLPHDAVLLPGLRRHRAGGHDQIRLDRRARGAEEAARRGVRQPALGARRRDAAVRAHLDREARSHPHPAAHPRRAALRPQQPEGLHQGQARHDEQGVQPQARLRREDRGRQHHPVRARRAPDVEDPGPGARAQQARLRARRLRIGQDLQLRRPQPAPAQQLDRDDRPQGRHAQAVRQLLPSPRLQAQGRQHQTRPDQPIDALQPAALPPGLHLDHADRQPAGGEHVGQRRGREGGLLRQGRAPALHGAHGIPLLLLRRPAAVPDVPADARPAPARRQGQPQPDQDAAGHHHARHDRRGRLPGLRGVDRRQPRRTASSSSTRASSPPPARRRPRPRSSRRATSAWRRSPSRRSASSSARTSWSWR